MPTKNDILHVTVYFDSPAEYKFAHGLMADTDSHAIRAYDGALEGKVKRSHLASLREHGLLIEPLPASDPDAPEPASPGVEDEVTAGLLSVPAGVEPARAAEPTPQDRVRQVLTRQSSETDGRMQRQLRRFEERVRAVTEAGAGARGRARGAAMSAAAAEGESSAERESEGAAFAAAGADDSYGEAEATASAGFFKDEAAGHDYAELTAAVGGAGAEEMSEEAVAAHEAAASFSGAAVAAEAEDEEEDEEEVYEVELRGPMRPEWQEALAAKGLEVISFRPKNMYRMFLTPDGLAEVCQLPFVIGAQPYGVGQTLTPDFLNAMETAESAASSDAVDDESSLDAGLLSAGPQGPAAEAVPEIFDVVCHRAQDMGKVERVANELGGAEVLESAGGTVRLKASINAPVLAALANLAEVKSLTPYRPPTLFSDYARALIGINSVNEHPQTLWTGAGEVVAVFDSGVDPDHPDIHDRIKESVPFRGAPAVDQVGHGTHVAGIIAGTGAASGDGKICGVAPGAQLIAVGIVLDDNTLALPVDLGELLKEATERGAKIINLSWGTPIGGSYDQGSASVDKFIYEHPDVLVVVAAGNSGTAPDGHAAYNTVGTPASAKNVLTVGACASDRPGLSQTWGTFRPQLFKLAPTKDLTVAGDPNLTAAISSRGPTDFDSVKPDLLAPGTFILSAHAKNFVPQLAWQDYPLYDNNYVYIGGTSMAAPFVAGAAAVLRQYLRQEVGMPNPSAALLKAILLASTRRLPALRPGLDEVIGYPDFDQGFGRLDLSSVLPHKGAPPHRRLQLVDIPNDSPDALQSRMPINGPRKSSRTYTFKLSAGATEPLRIALTWTDLPGNGVQNNLQLDMRGPEGLIRVGNPHHRYRRDPLFDDKNSEGLTFDKRNNVELVMIDPAQEALPAGEYRVRVIAQNTPFPPQGYALCVCGQLDSPLTAL